MFIGREMRHRQVLDPWNGPLGGGGAIMVWMGISLRYGGFIHIFEEDSSLKGNNFLFS